MSSLYPFIPLSLYPSIPLSLYPSIPRPPVPPTYTVASASTPSTTYSAVVTNTGSVAGDEVVLAFTVPKEATLRGGTLGYTVPVEKKKLFGFKRVTLAPGASTTVTFDLGPSQLAMVDAEGATGLHAGEFDIVRQVVSGACICVLCCVGM